MANSNFVVKNGLTVGPLTISATTGDITTSGNVTLSGSGSLGVSQIAKNDSSISINDTGTGSTVVINIDGTTETTIDAAGIKLPTGDAFYINNTSVLNATTLGSGVTASSLTSVGTIGTGVWQGSEIATTYTAAKVTSVNGSTGAITGLAVTAGNLAQFASTTSAQLAGIISDETGSGALVFANSPTLVTPALGTPASGVLTNVTGLPLATGVTGTLPVANGGTGVTTSTGTGSVVLSASPTFTGTLSAAIISTSGNVSVGGTLLSDDVTASTVTVSGDAVISGNLTVSGTQTIVNSTVVTVNDLNLVLANTAATSAAADGAGITVNGANATFTYAHSGTKWAMNKSLDVTGSVTSSSTVQGTALISTVATGTAPLTVTSTTKVANLNVEQVDGYHADTANTASTIAVRDASKNLAVSGVVLSGSTSGTSTLVASAAAGTTTHTLPAVTGTIITTGDTSTVTNTMLAGSISNAKLANSSITVNGSAISLGGSATVTATATNALTIGTGLSGTSYNGSAAVTIAIDSTVVTLTGTQTLTNKTLTSPTLTSPVLGTPSSGNLALCTFPTLNQNTTGSAATLTTSRNINGVAFNGSADITVAAAAGTLTGATLASGVTASSLTSVGTLTGLTVSGAIVPNANASVNLGSTTAWWGTVYGVSTQAKYADLAENYQADRSYPAGTVLMFGGMDEVTQADADTKAVAGIVSTNPAHLMNGGLTGNNVVALALQGRVPCKVVGPIAKGDLLVSAGFGYAKSNNGAGVGQVIGKALQDFTGAKGTIEVAVGRV